MKRLFIGLLFVVSMGSLAMDKKVEKDFSDSFTPDSFTTNSMIAVWYISMERCEKLEDRRTIERDPIPKLAHKLLKRVKRDCEIPGTLEWGQNKFRKTDKCKRRLRKLFTYMKFLKNFEQEHEVFVRCVDMELLDKRIENPFESVNEVFVRCVDMELLEKKIENPFEYEKYESDN